ncbi:MAG: hypothetical protein ACRDN9_16080 [Streptosporangiaceae bacterium]
MTDRPRSDTPPDTREATIHPFAIYYGWPSCVNGSGGDVAGAVASFQGFAVTVFGEGNVLPEGDPEAGRIIAGVAARGTVPYGYVTLGMTEGEPGWPAECLDAFLTSWKVMGVQGVLLDCAGADYGVSRTRFDSAVRHAHGLGLSVLANAWNPDDVLAGSSTMGRGDGYLGENDVLRDGRFLPPSTYRPKLTRMAAYKRALGITLYATGTTPRPAERQHLASRAVTALAPYGVDAFQLTDPDYSSRDNRLAPATP